MTNSAVPAVPPPAAAGGPQVPWERVERFVGQLAHDVRNGLNALELQLTFLGEISTDPEAVAEVKLIRQTLAEVTRSLQTVRGATTAPPLHKLDYPAEEFFGDLRERFERNEPARKSRVLWRVEVGPVSVCIDPEATMQAMQELLANALRFGPAEAAIDLVATLDATALVAELRESQEAPPAIPLDQWGRSPLLTTTRAAYGLGLFRVRRIIEAQGGSYGVEYSAANRTLITRVTLPLAGAS